MGTPGISPQSNRGTGNSSFIKRSVQQAPKHVKINALTSPVQRKLARKGIRIIFGSVSLAGARPVQHQLSARERVSQGQPTSQDAAPIGVVANNQKHPRYFSCYRLGFLTGRYRNSARGQEASPPTQICQLFSALTYCTISFPGYPQTAKAPKLLPAPATASST